MASIEKRTSKDGKITYRVKVRMRGRSVTESFSRRTDAKAWATQTEAAISEQRIAGTQARKHTLGDLADRFIKNELEGKKTAGDIGRHLAWWKEQIGGYRLAEVTPELLREARDQLKKGRSPGTVNRYHASLSSAFVIAMKEWGWLESNPMSRVKKLTEPRGRVRFLTDDEREGLLEACKESRSKQLYPIVVLALSTGMRKGEILKLTWDAVDLKKGHLTLVDTKNGETRGVPVAGMALKLLRKHAKVRRIDTQLVFPGREGEKPIEIKEAWEFALDRAKITDFRFHDLRHTAASYLAMSGATLAEIAEILGHKTLAMVKRYAHLTEQHTSAVVARMNERFLSES